MGKRIIAALLLLAVILTAAGCAVKERSFDRKDRDKENTGSWRPGLSESEIDMVPAQPSMNTLPQESTEAVDVPVQQEPQVVCYMHNTDYYTFDGVTYETLAGEITFYDNGIFVMVVNLYEGWGTLTGSYYFESPGYYYCTVASKDFAGFAGDNLQTFAMMVAFEGSYMIDLGSVYSIGMVEHGEYFMVG